MKIFFYSHTLCPGGAEKQCALIAAELKKRYAYECVVILNNGNGAKAEYLGYLSEANVELVVLPRGPFARFRHLLCLFRDNKNGVLFNYLTGPDVVGAFAARCAGFRRVVGGLETDWLVGKKFWAEKFTHALLAARTICNSYKAYDYFSSRGFAAERLVVMPSAMKLTLISELPERHDADVVRIVCVGRFCAEKDYKTWVDVIAEVRSKDTRAQAVIVGYGDLEQEIRAYITSRNLDEVISILPGRTTNVKTELGRSDVYLSTSIQEGTSNTILEAMDMALPIVATNVGDNARMIEDGASGFICPVKDVAKLSTSLLKLIQDADLRRNFGARSREILAAKYSLEKIASDYDDLIESLK